MIPSPPRLAVVTGTYSGIGSALSRRLASDGFDLVVLNRDPARASAWIEAVARDFPERTIAGVQIDLSDHLSIRRAAREIAERHAEIDLLVHNAGVLLDQERYSAQGNELHFEVNTLAPYLLTQLLRPQLRAAGRSVVLVVGSNANLKRPLDLEDLRRPKKFRKLFGSYAQSKLAVAMVWEELAPDYATDGILLRVAEPGAVKTSMTAGAGMPRWLLLPARLLFSAPEKAAERLRDAAVSPAFGDQFGIYVEKGQVKALPAAARDPTLRRTLLELAVASTRG